MPARRPPLWNPHHVDVCTPAQVEAPTGKDGYAGYHWIEPLKAWLYEIPKSGSSTLVQLFRTRHRVDDRRRRRPEPDDIAFAVVRDPLCRAISGFLEAYKRAAFRTNWSSSRCPFRRFPYLLDNQSSAEVRLGLALRTLATQGARLAGPACGYAYNHMLSQTYFIWPNRSNLWSEKGRIPRATRLLKLENLENELLAFCEERGAADFCRARLRGGLKQLNKQNSAMRCGGRCVSHESRDVVLHEMSRATRHALHQYYAADYSCLNYSRHAPPACHVKFTS